MHDFLVIAHWPSENRSQSFPEKDAYRRPDTYDAAAARVGLSRTHVFEIIHGNRDTTPEKRRALRDWARDNARQGRADAPAVTAALRTLAA